jgi:hypothetical protein
LVFLATVSSSLNIASFDLLVMWQEPSRRSSRLMELTDG